MATRGDAGGDGTGDASATAVAGDSGDVCNSGDGDAVAAGDASATVASAAAAVAARTRTQAARPSSSSRERGAAKEVRREQPNRDAIGRTRLARDVCRMVAVDTETRRVGERRGRARLGGGGSQLWIERLIVEKHYQNY